MPAPGELLFIAPRRAKPPRHLADLSAADRREAVAELGEKPFRAGQLSRHYFVHHTDGADGWTDIPAGARARLAEALFPALLTPARLQTCDAGTTRKTLWKLFDGALVESVVMRYPDRITVCVSSQAGCGMNCPFCATGQAGLTRNMSAAEIVEQVVAAARAVDRGEFAGDSGGRPDAVGGPRRISNIVFMGMGEPLANWKAVSGALSRMVDPQPDGLGISRRSIVVSTVGLVPGIEKLTESGFGVTLAVSLHAPDDELRDTLVPVNTRWKVAEVLDAAHAYFVRTGRRVSIEYALIRDVNDQADRAALLGRLLTAQGGKAGAGWVHVNLIPLNPTPGSKWTASRDRDSRTFVRRLEAAGVPVTVRDTRGREIDGACGQLAASDAGTT